MYSQSTTVINRSGLHARPAADFAKAAGKFQSKIIVKKVGENEDANAKSIISVLSLGIDKGTQIEIIATGGDEVEAINSLVGLVESGFGEN